MTSSRLQPKFSGLYSRHSVLNGRSVFATDCPYYLYYVDDARSFWFFSTEKHSTSGFIMGNEDVKIPSDVMIPWRAYNNATETWENDESITLTCLCEDLKSEVFILYLL